MAHRVGYVDGLAFDAERPAWRGGDQRPLKWSAWYPAHADAEVKETFAGPPGAELFHTGWLSTGAPLSEVKAAWPVVLLSHGTGGTADGLSWLGNRLARRGFIAIGVSHHGNTAIEPYLPEGFACWWERARDLSVVLDVIANDDWFKGRMDMANVFAAGFSLGAYTVLALAGAISDMALFEAHHAKVAGALSGPREFPDLAEQIPQLFEQSESFRQSMARHGQSYLDARVRALVLLAPAPPVWAFTPASLAAIQVPVTILATKGDTEAPYDTCALWLHDINPAFDLETLDARHGHYVFLCEATDLGRAQMPDITIDHDGVDRAAVHDRAATMAVQHFEAQLARQR